MRETARTVFRALKKKSVFIEVFLISNSEMRRINKLTWGKDTATNVLSFVEKEAKVKPRSLWPKFNLGRPRRSLGEIYIAPDYIKKNNQSLEHMVVHGLLHLCGYDHITKKDAEKMEKKEIDILKRV